MKQNGNEDLIPIRRIHKNIYASELRKMDLETESLDEQISDLENSNVNKEIIINLKTTREELKEKYDNWDFDKRRSMYENKREILANKIPELAFYYNENHTIKKNLTKAEAIIYEVLISAASTENTIIYDWVDNRKKHPIKSSEIVKIYEYIKHELDEKRKKEEADGSFIDDWLKELSYSLDYPTSKKIDDINQKLSVLRQECLGIRMQIEICITASDGFHERYLTTTNDDLSPDLFYNEIQFFKGLLDYFVNENDKYCRNVLTILQYSNEKLDNALFFEDNCKDNDSLEEEPDCVEGSMVLCEANPDFTLKDLNEIIYAIESNKSPVEATKESRFKEYYRMKTRCAELFPLGFPLNGRNVKLEFEQQVIYIFIIYYASQHGSYLNKFPDISLSKMTEAYIVNLYEFIKNEIFSTVDKTQSYPLINQWLKELDVKLDYTVSKIIKTISDKLEQFRNQTLFLRNKTVGKEELKTASELMLNHFCNKIEEYRTKAKTVCQQNLSYLLNVGRLFSEYEDKKEYTDKEPIAVFSEYVQFYKNVKLYLNSGNPDVDHVLKDLNIEIDDANRYMDYLIASVSGEC